MIPQIETLRETRDFLHVLVNMPPGALAKYLADFGEQVIDNANEALGVDAFKEGDKVLVNPKGFEHPFEGTIIGARLVGESNHVVFGVKTSNGDVVDCEVSELQLEELA